MSDRGPRPELLSFLGAIKAEPEEDTPKLALADWLQEQPDPSDQARGDFLRQFVRNNQLSKTDPAREDFGALVRLWNANEAAWAGGLKAAGFKVWATNHMFRWGLLFPVLDWSGHSAALDELVRTEEYAWVAGLAVRVLDPRATRALAASPLLDSLVGLRVAEGNIALLDLLCNSERACRLQWLDTGAVHYPDNPVARSPHLGALRHLVVNHFPSLGEFQKLCDSTSLGALRVLEATGAALTADAGRVFAESTGLPALVELNLGPLGNSSNGIGPNGLRALVAGARSGRLRRLNVAQNGITDVGAESLCAWSHMCNLTHLNLADNKLTNRAAVALAGAEHLNSLEHLTLTGNAITNDGALALANAPHLTNLRRLDLSKNQRLGKKAVAALRARFGDGVIVR